MAGAGVGVAVNGLCGGRELVSDLLDDFDDMDMVDKALSRVEFFRDDLNPFLKKDGIVECCKE